MAYPESVMSRCITCFVAAVLTVSHAAAAAADKSLVAHWTFDDVASGRTDCADSSGNGLNASLESKAKLTGIEGVFGRAMRLAGNHKLRIKGKYDFSKIKKITLTAWVLPDSFQQYNEIFRKDDGDKRILFSFQGTGSILSLGLNVNGYAECDARIDRKVLLDGLWHFCAATFDGKTMRVYLDGKQIGSLNRTGRIVSTGSARPYIGSNIGGECFQGAIDDLRIYSDALTADQIASMCEDGTKLLKILYAKQIKMLDSTLSMRKTLPETLAAWRKEIIEKRTGLTPKVANAARKKLSMSFPREYRNFTATANMDPMEYLRSPDDSIHEKLADRVLGPLGEYKPLTENQWRRQTPENLKKWKALDAAEKKFAELRKQGAASRFSPGWIEAAMQIAQEFKSVPSRPTGHERAAPYVRPSTPETKTLTPDQAKEALQRDWLHQADGKPSAGRIADEIKWTRALAARIKSESGGKVDLAAELAKLDVLAEAAGKLKSPDRELYFKIRSLKRDIAFKNPAVNFSKMLMVDMPYPAGSEPKHETKHRLGYMAVPGGRLLVLDGLSPAGALRQLMPKAPLHGSFWRPDVSFDGKKILFCFKPHNEKSFHLYEINPGGGQPVQLTDGPYDDLDPIYLPDGHIMFSTTRGHTYVRCMPPTNAYPLARCDNDGKNIYLISRNNEPDYLPAVMNDGKVIYTRWEYTDKPLWRAQGLWTVNPDGTQVDTFWGNQSVWPDLLKDARPIPGSRRIMFTGSAHHNWFAGSVGIITPGKGFNFPEGLTKVTADVGWPESGNGPSDPVESPNYHKSGRYGAYYSPYPLSEKDFIVSANRGGRFVLYLMDVEGNRELIYEGVNNIFHAMPLKARTKPPVIEDRVTWPTLANRGKPRSGVIYTNNVYQGAPRELAGKARHLRILNIEHKTYTYWYKRPYLSTGPVVSGVQSEGVKRILGTVPIEKDGSLAFEAPAGIPLHFQLLDENFLALQTMRSFTGVMPGERRGCLGCHERHSATSPPAARAIALKRQPSKITSPPWGDDTVSFERYVRPVLDKYCGKCHQGKGKAVKKLNMTPRPGRLGFDETYWLFTGRPAWGRAYKMPKNPPPGFGIAGMIMVEGYHQRDPVAYATPKPMTRLSYKSRLVDIASSGKHNKVKVDPVSRRKLIAWVDTMCPYRGDKEVRAIPDPIFPGSDWLSIRPRIKTAPRITRPGPVD
ncbi:MAG: hypothetical protein QGH60_07100 [Phycisphaerae bacterium]|jgi:hypothetical protein|nr:hypothetical protein [Phycisphaerae bacterium]